SARTSAAPAAAASRGPGGHGGVPMLGGAGAGGQPGDGTHARPPWLLQDDAESIWFAGLPEYCEPVIGSDPDAHRR
ncbi:MAG: hypothetical protein ACT4RN_22760, partial [Pseudonocardia sp.]